jgi:hypothetical protein
MSELLIEIKARVLELHTLRGEIYWSTLMGDKLRKIYGALVKGATDGMTDQKLFRHVLEECPKTTSKKIVKASLFALRDRKMKDAAILNTIYALAIKHRLDPSVKKDGEREKALVKPHKKLQGKAIAPAAH